jgi:hypothetical protein
MVIKRMVCGIELKLDLRDIPSLESHSGGASAKLLESGKLGAATPVQSP